MSNYTVRIWAYTGPNYVWICSWADIYRTCTTFLLYLNFRSLSARCMPLQLLNADVLQFKAINDNLKVRYLKNINYENAWAFTYLPRSPNIQSFCPKVPFLKMDWDTHHLTSCCDVIWWDTISHKWLYMEVLCLKPGNSRFLTSWPWPLTYDLDLKCQPR